MKTHRLLWPTFWTIVAFATLVCLGVWQLQRLEWKTALIKELNSAYQEDPAQTNLTYQKLQELPEGKILRGTLQGVAKPDHLTWLEMRPCNGLLGSDALLPVKTLDGYIWLNLGCVSSYNRGAVDKMITARHNLIRVDIKGIALAPRKAAFKPENNAEENEWYQFDAQAMADSVEINDIAPILVIAEEKLAKGRDEIIPYSEHIMPANNHLQYAIFWFTMSLVLWVIYYFRFIRKSAS
ncbi:MAG: hypothetical protein GC136_01620 [Alphaproteobacteria bacterium]|nr:hypothetical protein [Alphaproteobacteria bacterium]